MNKRIKKKLSKRCYCKTYKLYKEGMNAKIDLWWAPAGYNKGKLSSLINLKFSGVQDEEKDN